MSDVLASSTTTADKRVSNFTESSFEFEFEFEYMIFNWSKEQIIYLFNLFAFHLHIIYILFA